MASSCFVLYHLIRDRCLREALHNHVIMSILIVNLFYEATHFSLCMHYFRAYESFSVSVPFRLVWGYIDWTFFLVQYLLFAWVTIERHILIFHDQLVATREKRLFLHDAPPIILVIYCLTYYAVIFFGIPCENNFEYLTSPSITPCSLRNTTQYIYEFVAHLILPTFITVLSSFGLLLRAPACSLASVSQDDDPGVSDFIYICDLPASLHLSKHYACMWYINRLHKYLTFLYIVFPVLLFVLLSDRVPGIVAGIAAKADRCFTAPSAT